MVQAEYADAALASDVSDEIPDEICERDGLIEYMKKCSENYITRSDPRRYLQQRMLFEKVSGTEGTAVHVEVGKGFASLGICCVHGGSESPSNVLALPVLFFVFSTYHYYCKAITRR